MSRSWSSRTPPLQSASHSTNIFERSTSQDFISTIGNADAAAADTIFGLRGSILETGLFWLSGETLKTCSIKENFWIWFMCTLEGCILLWHFVVLETPYLNSFHSHVFNGLHGWWKPSFVILHFQFKFYILNLELVSFVVILQSFDYFLRVSTKWGSGNDQMMIRWWPVGDQFHENDDSHLCLSRVNLSILYSKRLPGLAKQHRYRPGFKSSGFVRGGKSLELYFVFNNHCLEIMISISVKLTCYPSLDAAGSARDETSLQKA